jgi:hypothetical protein
MLADVASSLLIGGTIQKSVLVDSADMSPIADTQPYLSSETTWPVPGQQELARQDYRPPPNDERERWKEEEETMWEQ